jgi:hypothetical protein
VVQRLIGLGLLEPAGEEAGSRGEREVGITSSGIAALRKWLTPPIPSVEVAHTIDLLRLRMFFLDILDAATREGFIDDTLAKLKEHVLELEMQAAKTGSPFSKLGVLGAVYETKARIEWLEHVKTKLPELQRSEPD